MNRQVPLCLALSSLSASGSSPSFGALCQTEDKARVERWNWVARHVEQTEGQKRVNKEMLPWLARTGCLILLVHELTKRSTPTWAQSLLILPILGLMIVNLRKSKAAADRTHPPHSDKGESDQIP
ncbi:MAG: hypothetical protein K1X67_19415 [Fimbriimonadaceae bacterium]|nr:hypothetical protein [Fimbriimonadaceae bacterium]